ncbi:ScbA/BarX family gamma-butyrolactone biosynthesis protein [Phaeacidiphilus oryzae]|uniref:ScbA/BarX family gamma-butyrolactone biosynthesis protein n=1 Tax=Phaeacidiphilus oryzae TaxID=348818 RepID=UPI0007C6A9D6|nr:ScbA/BarX family gamma-butyrolactone biosynthesis protein [Phaeacidiphilus oryzae]
MPTTLAPALAYSATVPRALVHRAAICEVFLTDHTRAGEDEYLIAAQLPRVHSFYSDHLTSPAAYDPLLLIEVLRQASILVAHAYLEASADSKFIFVDGEFALCPDGGAEALRIGPLPGRVLIRARQASVKHREGTVVGSTLDLELLIDDRPAATMRTTCQWMPPAAWDRMRARGRDALALHPARPHHTGRRVPPAAVGRGNPQNVVLAEAGLSGDGEGAVHTQIVVDQAHPALFDHPLDHLPGALTFEALRQSAVFAAQELFGLSPRCLQLSLCAAEFVRFGEFELPTDCRVRPVAVEEPDTVGFEVSLFQEETEMARSRVHLSRTSPIGVRFTPVAAPASVPAAEPESAPQAAGQVGA